MPSPVGVTFVIPVHNGDRWLDRTLSAVLTEAAGHPSEVIVVDDGSGDGSRELLERHAKSGVVRLLDGPRLGAAAAINHGIRHAKHPIVCQIDQDVILHSGWLARLLSELRDDSVAAAQGCYVVAPHGSIWSRVMGLDLTQRYSQIQNTHDVDHVCTGNTAYRASAIAAAGLLDEDLGYGYDNDLSYRLIDAGFRLAICPEATSTHEWRDDLKGYVRQQYGFGYGRLDLVSKHRHRLFGDDVSRFDMMLHAPLMGAVVAGCVAAAALAAAGYRFQTLLSVSAGLLGLLVVERFIAGARAAMRFRDRAGFFFVPAHLVRDLAWSAAGVVWLGRRFRGLSSRPGHSMHPREAKPSTTNHAV